MVDRRQGGVVLVHHGTQKAVVDGVAITHEKIGVDFVQIPNVE